MNSKILSLVAPLLLFACKSDNDDPSSSPADPKNTIQLNNLKEGQQNQYLRFSANCSDHNGTFEYTGDTLVVTVLEDGEGLKFFEEFTKNSTHMNEEIPSIHKVFAGEDYILVPERQLSYLFFFYGNDTIHLTKPEDINLNQGSCFIEYPNGEPFIGEEIGFLSFYEYQDMRYTNNRIVSCVPMILDLDAYLVYDETQLKMSQTRIDDFTSVIIEGYTLLK
ncbi:MAG: hypothetical protein MK086_00700 [Flavobacteriales bacterium]|nr:hypothetical protein [Flavobacteriales bacterium]